MVKIIFVGGHRARYRSQSDHDLRPSQMLDQLSHSGTPWVLILPGTMLSVLCKLLDIILNPLYIWENWRLRKITAAKSQKYWVVESELGLKSETLEPLVLISHQKLETQMLYRRLCYMKRYLLYLKESAAWFKPPVIDLCQTVDMQKFGTGVAKASFFFFFFLRKAWIWTLYEIS